MKTLKISKNDKQWGTQPPNETLRKVFTGNIFICLDGTFHQSTQHRNNDLGEERRRILIISKSADKSVGMRSERRL